MSFSQHIKHAYLCFQGVKTLLIHTLKCVGSHLAWFEGLGTLCTLFKAPPRDALNHKDEARPRFRVT